MNIKYIVVCTSLVEVQQNELEEAWNSYCLDGTHFTGTILSSHATYLNKMAELVNQ